MSDKEIQRLAVLQDVRDHRITQVRAAEILNLSTRQITRLLQKLNQDGVSGMAHASRGQPGHRSHDGRIKLFRNILTNKHCQKYQCNSLASYNVKNIHSINL